MMKSFVLILPGERPPSVNGYYAGKHWSARVRESKRIFAVVQAACVRWKAKMRSPLPRLKRVRLTVRGYFAHHPLDASNIFVKPYEDALVRLGVIPDDDPAHVISVTTKSHVDKENPRVEIILEEVNDEKARASNPERKRA